MTKITGTSYYTTTYPTQAADSAASTSAGVWTDAQSAYSTSEDELMSLDIDSEDEQVALLQKQSQLAQDTYQKQIEQYEMQIANLKLELKNLESQRTALMSKMLDPQADVASILSDFSSISNSKFEIYSQIQSLGIAISNTQLKMEQEAASTSLAIEQIQALSDQNTALMSTYDGSSLDLSSLDTNSEVGELSAQMGLSFVGVINSDEQGNAEFSREGATHAWCADFVSTVIKRAYEAKGLEVPSGFGSSSVSTLRSWGEDNGIYLDTLSSDDKAQLIATYVKPGDIMIEKEGKSHTGIVTKVYPDGSFDTVEGNSGDAVKTKHYSADSSTLSGFVLMNAL